MIQLKKNQSHQNHLIAILNCAWRKKYIIFAIFAVSIALAYSNYTSRISYTSKGMLLVQRAQNSVLQEISSGGKSAQSFSSFTKDLYLEKFLMYLNSRDFFMETAEVLLEHPQFAEHEKYLLPDWHGDKVNRINSLASNLSWMTRIEKNGSLGIEFISNVKNPQFAVFITEVVMNQANIFIMDRELKELNAARDYLQSNLMRTETSLAGLFDQHIEAVRKNPKIQEASKKVLLEKISVATSELEKLKMEIKSNELLLSRLKEIERAETGKISSGKAEVGSHFDRSVDEMKAHVSALVKKRDTYISSGMSKNSKIVSDLEKEIEIASKNFLAMSSDSERNFNMGGTPVLGQIKYLQQENLLKSQKILSLQEMLQGIFKDGIDQATYEQNSNDLLKRAEIQYALFTDLTKQLFVIDMQSISVQNRIMAIERPDIETVERHPAFLNTMMLGVIFAFALSYLYLLQVDRSDPIINSAEDLAAVGSKILGFVPPLRMNLWLRKGPVEKINHKVDSSASLVFKNIRSKMIRRHNESDKSCSIVMVTSSRPEEGKTFFSVNLAQAIAQAGLKTIAIDIDSRSQGLTRFFSKTSETGLIEYLSGSQSWAKSIYSVSDSLDVLPAGNFSHGTSELLLTSKMEGLLAELANHYEIIVIDSAPILIVGDAINMLSGVDDVVVIARAGVTRFHELARTLDYVAEGGASPQVILNMSGTLGSYNYGQKPIKRAASETNSSLKPTG